MLFSRSRRWTQPSRKASAGTVLLFDLRNGRARHSRVYTSEPNPRRRRLEAMRTQIKNKSLAPFDPASAYPGLPAWQATAGRLGL